jgi:hypothetical protein
MTKWPKKPYKGLQYYGVEDEPIFAGRDDEIVSFARVLAVGAVRIALLHGTTGSGKSSFLRAGVIPFLERPDHAFVFPRLDRAKHSNVLFIRSTSSPLQKLADNLYDLGQQDFTLKTPRGPRTISLKDALLGYNERDSFLDKVGRSPELMCESLTLLVKELPRTQVLVIDQAEEVFTLQTGDASEAANAFFQLLALLTRTPCDLKLILSLRTEYYKRFYDELGKLTADLRTVTDFELHDLDKDCIVAAVKHPAKISHYNFSFVDDVPEQIAAAVTKAMPGQALPAIQIVCKSLYEQLTSDQRVIGFNEYRDMGTIDEQIGQHIDLALLDALTDSKYPWPDTVNEHSAWQPVLGDFCTVQADGSITTKFLSLSEIRERAQRHGCRGSVEAIVEFLASDDQRILRRVDAAHAADIRYSLGHDVVGTVLNTRGKAPSATPRLSRMVTWSPFLVSRSLRRMGAGEFREFSKDRWVHKWLRSNARTSLMVESEVKKLLKTGSTLPPADSKSISRVSEVLPELLLLTAFCALIILAMTQFIYHEDCGGLWKCLKVWVGCDGEWNQGKCT